MVSVWELDFYSRPLLDEQQKRRWEVLICEGLVDTQADPDQLFRYSKLLSNTEVNSLNLQAALEEAMAQAPNRPSRIRYFRYQMQNMIQRACEAAGVPAVASRRTLALQRWLQERQQLVYPNQPGYTTVPAPSVAAPPPAPRSLPDALIGQRWSFASLPASAFEELPEWSIDFGESFPLSLTPIAPATPIPGLLIFSPRATALAAWLSGLELAYWRVETGPPAQLILETGAADSWVLAALSSPPLVAEAQAFDAAKTAADQVHFLAVQTNPDSEEFAGFWLLRTAVVG